MMDIKEHSCKFSVGQLVLIDKDVGIITESLAIMAGWVMEHCYRIQEIESGCEITLQESEVVPLREAVASDIHAKAAVVKTAANLEWKREKLTRHIDQIQAALEEPNP